MQPYSITNLQECQHQMSKVDEPLLTAPWDHELQVLAVFDWTANQ